MCLKTLVNVKYEALESAQPGGPVISKAEAKIIFGNMEKILNIHQKLAKQMEVNLNKWESDTTISMREIIRAKFDLKREYEIYATNVEECQREYQLYENENYRFKELTLLNNTDKQNLKNVYVRPFQRLCSIFLLLKEIKKHTRDSSSDKEYLLEATDVIRQTIKTMDENKFKSDNQKEMFNIFYSIENCPADLITSHRELITQFSAQEITKKKDSYNSLGLNLTFFLFSDVLEICKLRRPQAVKPYKHIVNLSLCMVLNILHFEEKDASQVFGFIIRDLTSESKTTTCCFQFIEGKNELNEILLMIAKQISLRSCSKSADDYIIKEIPAGRLSVQPINTSVKVKSPSGIIKQVRRKLFGNTNNNSEQRNILIKRRSASCGELDIL